MKLLFTQDALVNAGAERSHLEILSRFSPDVEVVFVYFYPKHDLKEEYQDAGIRLHFLNIPESYSFGTAIFHLVRLIRKEKPDLLVSSLYRADIITRFAALITGVPLVGTLVNDSYGPFARKEKPGFKYQLVYLFDRWTAGIPIHWIANAESLVDSHVKTLGLKRDKISVVYRGRNVPPPRSVSPQTETTEKKIMACEDTVHGEVPVIARTAGTKQSDSGEQRSRLLSGEIERLEDKRPEIERLSVNKNKNDEKRAFRFLSYGRLLERKGFQEAILAFSEVVRHYPDCTLTIYGEGPYRAHLERLISKLGLQEKVILPGKITDPHCLLLLPTAHCFLFPSWYEGFSGALVEAMMAGIPIIASDISMNLEAVTADKNALTFPVKDVGALTQKMLYAIENPDRMAEFGKAARIEAIQRFDIEKIAKEYEGVLHVIQKNLTPALS
ncbi:MAG: glycosyltransferase family 4 protein [Algoriphagus sp.]|nr:glycosyltransferase family 4 protein [Algoriphagus sp.]